MDHQEVDPFYQHLAQAACALHQASSGRGETAPVPSQPATADRLTEIERLQFQSFLYAQLNQQQQVQQQQQQAFHLGNGSTALLQQLQQQQMLNMNQPHVSLNPEVVFSSMAAAAGAGAPSAIHAGGSAMMPRVSSTSSPTQAAGGDGTSMHVSLDILPAALPPPPDLFLPAYSVDHNLVNSDGQNGGINRQPPTTRSSPGLGDPPFPMKRDDDDGNDDDLVVQQSSMDTASLLHNSCKLYPETLAVVESALRMDPGAIRRRIQVVCPKNSTSCSSDLESSSGSKMRQLEKYCYPVNIALKHNASLDVLDLLIREGPDVLSEKDRTDEACTLSIALEVGKGVDVIRRILNANPRSARTVDRHFNTPLHILVARTTLSSSSSSTLDVVRLVYHSYPQALKLENFHRHTPMDVAVRREVCPEEVLDFLQAQTFQETEDYADHLDEDDD